MLKPKGPSLPAGEPQRQVPARRSWPTCRRQDAEVIGVSMFTFNRKRSFELLALAREALPGAPSCWPAGPIPTHLAAEVFEECPALDAIVQGRGGAAPAGRRGAAAAAGRRTGGTPRASSSGTGRPSPSRPWRTWTPWAFPRSTSRRTSWTTPASWPTSAPAGAARPPATSATPRNSGAPPSASAAPASVLREMALLRERHGLTYFSFRDDTFTANRGAHPRAHGRASGHRACTPSGTASPG